MPAKKPDSKFGIEDISSDLIFLLSGKKDVQHSTEVYNRLEIAVEKQKILYLEELVREKRSASKDKRLDRRLRRKYSQHVMKYLWSYSVFVAAVIIVNGFCSPYWKVDTAIIVVLSGSTAIAAIGLVGFVIRGMFNIE